jgi:hypothetical protein
MTLPNPPFPRIEHSHRAIVDSGTPLHIFGETLFLSHLREDHTPVSGFQGSTSRATHRGALTCRLRTSATQALVYHHQPDSVLVVPDTMHNLFSVRRALECGHSVIMEKERAGIYLRPCNDFVPFEHDPDTGLWFINLYPPASASNDIYAMPTSVAPPVEPIMHLSAPPRDLYATQDDREQALTLHHQLGHINTQRARELNIKGIPSLKGGKHFKCPTCLASKARRHPRAPSSTPEARPCAPWQDIHVDLSGKMLKTSRGNQYFVPFICRYTGAKHVDFISHKNHFILAYKRFVATTGSHPAILRSDLGSEFICGDLAKVLADNYVKHIICAKGEHSDNGPAESAVYVLRNAARAMMLHANVPLTLWDYCLSHAAYLNNITSPCRADPSKSIFEFLTGAQADLSRIPPIGAFTCIHVDRRQLKNQSLGLPSIQGAFIGIAIHKAILGYCIYTADHKVHVARHHIAFDSYLYPFQTTYTTPPIWQSYSKLVRPSTADSSTAQDATDITAPPDSLPDNSPAPDASPANEEEEEEEEAPDIDGEEEEESDVDDDAAANDADNPAVNEDQDPTSSKRKRIPNSKYIDTSAGTPKQTKLQRYKEDINYQKLRDDLLNTTFVKHFKGHGDYTGTIKEYYPSTDNYYIVYNDGDDEILNYQTIQRYIPGTPEHARNVTAQSIILSFATAVKEAKNLNDPTTTYTTPESYKEARAAPDALGWMDGCDTEIGKLRKLNCWTVVARRDIPANALVMGSRWTFRYKFDELGNLLQQRSRIVCKGFTQQKDINYFETFSPVVSFVTIRTLFALTSLPGFEVHQYDVSVAFIEAPIDPNSPPIYCECAEGYEDRRLYVYQLHRYLYGMKDAPRGYNQLFAKLCRDQGMKQLKSDECVFLTTINNSKSDPLHEQPNLNSLAIAQTIPLEDRIHPDCPHRTAVLIVASYVDDNLVYCNCPPMRKSFEQSINKRIKMNSDGPVNWYLSVKYDRDLITGAVSANQETYINKILKRWGLSECNPLPTPFPSKPDAFLDQLALPVEPIDPDLRKQYQELVGQLLYLQVHTVPEISWITSQLARYMAKPGNPHMTAAKKVLRYLQGRKHIPMRWCAASCRAPHKPGHIYGYADASFADVKPNRKSSTGYVFMLNNAAISWRSARTPLQVLNAAEAELVGLCTAAQEAVFLRKLCQELGFIQHQPTVIYEDCQAAVALSKENRFRKRSKHISLRWSYVVERQRPDINDIKAVSVSRTLMLADIFASPRSAAQFGPFRNMIIGRLHTPEPTPPDVPTPGPESPEPPQPTPPNRGPESTRAMVANPDNIRAMVAGWLQQLTPPTQSRSDDPHLSHAHEPSAGTPPKPQAASADRA